MSQEETNLTPADDSSELSVDELGPTLFRYLILKSNTPIFLIDPHQDFRFVYVNPATCRHYGASHEALLRMSIPDWDPNFGVEECEKHWTRVKTEKTIVFETIHRLPVGKTIPVEICSNYVKSAGREFIAGWIQDISERKHAAEELERFAYVASHDLQQPLRTIITHLSLLERRSSASLDSAARDLIGLVTNSAQRMGNLIRDLLAYSKVKQKVARAPIDLETLIDEVLHNLALEIEETAAVITHDPLTPVVGDKSALLQIFQNLIENALKYHGDRPTRIHIDMQAIEDEWRFCVSDTGVGIAPGDLERIFMVFYRGSLPYDTPGTGIGLSICKKAVEQHGGKDLG